MAAPKSPRKGSLQYWPRKRASKFLPSVNWPAIKGGKSFKGFIAYKVGMISGMVKDSTSDALTKDKRIIIPLTILECPPIKILSIKFYKNNKPITEFLSESLDKELKRKLKLPKQTKKISELKINNYDDVRALIYSQVKKSGLKKAPDLVEVAVAGETPEEKLNFLKERLDKEISVMEIFEKKELIDIRGLTKGKGLQGPVKRFGITLKFHKSEKGVRRPGSLGPWHPARTTYLAPQAGQLGMFTRVIYNNKILDLGKADGKFREIKNFGEVKTDYILVKGSVQGPAKRQLLLTPAMRPTKKQIKKNYELLELR